MREFVANFQKKHGQQVPMPKIYGDEDSSDSEGLELAEGTKVGKKTTRSACGGGSASTSGGGSTGTGGRSGIGGSGGNDLGRGRKRGRDDNGDDDDDPNKCRKTEGGGGPPRPTVARKEPCKVGTVYPRSTKGCQSLYLSPEGENPAGPSHVGLDSGAEEDT